MSRVVPYAAATCAAVSGWLVRGALAVQSAAPNAPKIGLLPPVWELALFILAASCVVFLLRPSKDAALPLFATSLCWLPWLPGIRSAAFVMWTGPLAVAVWCGAVTAAVIAGGGAVRRGIARLDAEGRQAAFPLRPQVRTWDSPRSRPAIAALAAAAVFAVVAFGARNAVPAGDEPHYLIITQSLLYDGDLQIENNHARRDYERYFPGTLQPDFWRRGQNGAIYSVHAPGLPALVAPAFVIGGYRAVVVFLIAIAALAAGLLWRLAFAVTGQAGAAWFAVAATATATPIAFHGFTVFPDGPAGLILLTGVWALFRLSAVSAHIPLGSPRAWALHGLALALLPWMHARLAMLAGAMGLAILARMPRTRTGLVRAAAFLAIPLVSAVAWFAFFYVIYGTPSPAAPWTRLVTSWRFIPGGLAGMLFDQQFGAMLYAPVLLIAAAGWFPLLRANRRLALELAAVALPYVIVTTRLWIWWGGWSAPARFWTPLFWVGGITAAVAWAAWPSRAARGTALAALVISATTTFGLGYAYGGRLAYNVRDGYARWFDWVTPLADLPLGLPSFFRLPERPYEFGLEILVVVGTFTLAFVALRWADIRVQGRGAFTLAFLTTYAVAGMIALSAILRLNGSEELRVSVAQLRLLAAARDDRRTAVRYRHPWPERLPVDDLLGTLQIESPPRLAKAPDAPALVLPGWFPAGTYRLSAVVNGAQPTPWELRILRAGPPILGGIACPSSSRMGLAVSFPVDAPAVIMSGNGLHAASLQPVHVATTRKRFVPARGNSARRYGHTVAWFVDENAFDDPDGIWIKGDAADARIVLQPDAGSWVRVLVRNGPVENEGMLATEAGDWTWSAPMKPGQENEVRVPVDPARGAVMLRVRSLRGFRPSDVDPSSRDTRLLGVWMSPLE